MNNKNLYLTTNYTTMKNLLLVSILFSIVFLSCKNDSSEDELGPGTTCIIANDSVSQYLQGANYWDISYYETDLTTPVSGLVADKFDFIDSSIDSLKTNSSKQVCYVLDCGRTLYVGNASQTLLHLTLKAQNSFRFTKTYQSRTIVGIGTRN